MNPALAYQSHRLIYLLYDGGIQHIEIFPIISLIPPFKQLVMCLIDVLQICLCILEPYVDSHWPYIYVHVLPSFVLFETN